jgi:transposase
MGKGAGKRYKLCLSREQRDRLEEVSRNGQAAVKKILHAQVLLMSDEGELAPKKWKDEEISAALNLHRNTVGRIRKQFLKEGEEPALNRKVRKLPPVPPKVDGHLEAQIIALCCSEAPEGRAKWSIRLLTSELKARQIVVEISRETVRQTLKKTNYVLGEPSDFASQSEI